MSDSVEVTDPLINAVVDEILNDAHPDCVELEERQRAVDEERGGSRLPQVDGDDDIVVAPEIVAMLRRPPYSEKNLCTIKEGGRGSVI